MPLEANPENQFNTVLFTMKKIQQITVVTVLTFTTFVHSTPNNEQLKNQLMNCDTCKSPTFHGRDFYLPFCADDQTYANLCEAVCANSEITPSKGSCDKCEKKKCGPIFMPVCSPDGKRLYANKCHANCAGAEFTKCQGLNMVIPGETPLPPNHELPLRLQNVGQETEDEDV